MTLRAWYRLVAQATAETAELFIYDSIGRSWWDDDTVTAKQFTQDLAALPDAVKTIKVRVNSPGGDVFDALAIANALRAQRTERGRAVEMQIDGLAASAATVITMAGDPIRIAKNGLVMVHNPQGFAMGDSRDMRKIAELLDKARESILVAYHWHSALSDAELIALMDAVTWLNADEAIAQGFATEAVEDPTIEARFRPAALAGLGEIPATYRPRVDAWIERPAAPPDAAEPRAIIAACRTAGFPELAEDCLGQPMDAVTARLARETAARAAAAAYAQEVRGLCTTARLPELAAGYIQAATPVAIVKAQLTTLAAKLDQVEIDSGRHPDGSASEAAQGWSKAIAKVQGTRKGV